MEPAKTFPIYQLMDAFEAFCSSEPDAKAQHRSLYYFLLAYCRRRGNTPRFSMPYETGMHGSKIGSWKTYDEALKGLAGWGFIEYTPGANRYKTPVVAIQFRNPTDDVLLTYWQSYCLSTANPSAVLPATIKEVLNKGSMEVGGGHPLPAKNNPAERIARKAATDDVPTFTADTWPGLNNATTFASICADLRLPLDLDRESYRAAIQDKMRSQEMSAPATTLRSWINTYFINAKKSGPLLTVTAGLPTRPTPESEWPAVGKEYPGQLIAFAFPDCDQSMARMKAETKQKYWPTAQIYVIPNR